MRDVQRSLQSSVSVCASSFAEWSEAISANFLPLDCARDTRGDFRGRASLAHFGDSVVGDIEVGAHRVVRRRAHAEASDAGYFKIFWQLAGASRIAQREHEAVLNPGAWSVYDTTQPYSVEMAEGCRALVLLVPQARSFGWQEPARTLCGRALPGVGAARIAAAALGGLLHDAMGGHALDHRAQGVLEDSMVALVETALQAAAPPHAPAARHRLGDSRVRRIVAYIDAELHDPDLCAQRLATVFNVSRRTLYNLFREYGQTPHAYIQARRLQRAAQQLAARDGMAPSITEVAFGLGFVDAAHFSRAFHERFGMSRRNGVRASTTPPAIPQCSKSDPRGVHPATSTMHGQTSQRAMALLPSVLHGQRQETRVNAPEQHPHPIRSDMLIDGQWRQAASGETFAVFDPATGQTIAHVPSGDAADVDAAVASARQAFQSAAWRDMMPAQRESLLLKLADLVEQHGEELARLETLNNGKLLAFAHGLDVGGSAQWLRYMAGWATKIDGQTFDISMPHPPGTRYSASTRRAPVGVVGAIVPWNFPLLMAVWKIAPALACGCTVVLKPAEETPLTAIRLGELALEAGFPPGVFNVVTGDGVAGAALVAHPGVDKITFTGSTEVGRLIGARCGQDIRRVSLELGGKSPVVVLDDCDPAVAIQGASAAIFFNQGQVCTAGSRLYVSRRHYDHVVEGIARVADAMVLGSGLDPASQMGPLVSARHRDKVVGMIDTSRREGAEIVAGGAEVQRDGYFVRPTVVANTGSRDLEIVREEVFGPVVVAMPFDDLDAVLAAANQSAYGLGASVWSNNLRAVQRLVDGIDAGTVWVNCHNVIDPNMPFGGYKASGVGREHGRSAIESYTELKSVCMAY